MARPGPSTRFASHVLPANASPQGSAPPMVTRNPRHSQACAPAGLTRCSSTCGRLPPAGLPLQWGRQSRQRVIGECAVPGSTASPQAHTLRVQPQGLRARPCTETGRGQRSAWGELAGAGTEHVTGVVPEKGGRDPETDVHGGGSAGRRVSAGRRRRVTSDCDVASRGREGRLHGAVPAQRLLRSGTLSRRARSRRVRGGLRAETGVTGSRAGEEGGWAAVRA